MGHMENIVELEQVAAVCVLGAEVSGVEASVAATPLFVWGVGMSRTDSVVCGGWGSFLFSLF